MKYKHWLGAAFAALLATFSAGSQTTELRVTTSHTEVDSDGYVRDPQTRKHIPRADGALSGYTSFKTMDGLPLDPSTVHYVVVPKQYRYLLGCAVIVRNHRNGRTFVAVAGDIGHRFGEVSVRLAKDLDSRTSPWNGIGNAVSYDFVPSIRLRAATDASLRMQLRNMTAILEANK